MCNLILLASPRFSHHPNHEPARDKSRKRLPGRQEWSPPSPELVLLAPAPRAVVLALDLSQDAVAQVSVE